MNIELASPDDLATVMNVFDGADLQVSGQEVAEHIDSEEVLIARSDRGTIIGALVGRPRERDVRIEPVAVRPGRRGQGIGTELIRAAGDRWGRLTATFDADLTPFYRHTGFEIEGGERRVGYRPPPK
jgi:GNAT superfamily N-acetyltransferase